MNALEQFNKQKYLNLKAFRRNGESMKTSVWFVQNEKTLYVQTVTKSGKVKRIRRNPRVKITPCRMNGSLLKSRTPVKAVELRDIASQKKIERLLDKKMGFGANEY